MKNVNNFQIAMVQPRGVAYFVNFFSLGLLIKVLLRKKSVYIKACRLFLVLCLPHMFNNNLYN